MNTLEGLKAVRALLTPDTWCKGSCAKNDKGQKITVSSSEACQWCLLGAIMKVTNYDIDGTDRISGALYRVIGSVGIPKFNDRSTFEDVAKALDRAIEIEAMGPIEISVR